MRERRRLQPAGTLVVVVAALAGLTACARSTPAVQAQPVAVNTGASAGSALQRPNSPASVPSHALLRVPAQSQLPALPNGCEVTSLSMLFTAVGHPVDKLTLAAQQPTNSTQPVFRPRGHLFSDILRWGDPDDGFVGAVAGHQHGVGYGIYHRPLTKLADHILPGRTIDLTGRPFNDVLAQVANGTPVVTWVTSLFKPTDDWVTWAGPHGPVHATQYEHAVLLVGYDQHHVYVNNPLTGIAGQQLDRASFANAWNQLGEQALTITKVATNTPAPA